MKKSVFLVLLMLAGVHTAFAQRYDLKVWKNGAYVQYMVNSVDSVTYSKLVESIEILPATLELQIGETYQMNATIMPEDADNRTYTWECSPHVIISETGLVKGMVKGVGTITCKANDGSGVSATCQVTITKPDGGEPEEYEYVDLGLPSGTLWATMNVGASNPEECGDYFAWGEVYPKESYSWSTYLLNGTDGFTKYTRSDGLTELLPEDDAATANWGSDWQMPSAEQIDELLSGENTTKTQTTLNDVPGIQVTSKFNNNSIFLPLTGYYGDVLSDVGKTFYYWGRSLSPDDSNKGIEFYISEGSSSLLADWEYRYYGQSVRPVRK